MSNNSIEQQISDAVKKHMTRMYQESFVRAKEIARRALYSAVANRLNAPGAHNFTGNFLNSIVVVLLNNTPYGEKKIVMYAKDTGEVREVIRDSNGRLHGKMTVMYYFFPTDYDDVMSRRREDEQIPTDRQLARSDAEIWARSQQLKGGSKNTMYEILLGYAAEYADVIPYTSGISETIEDIANFTIQNFELDR